MLRGRPIDEGRDLIEIDKGLARYVVQKRMAFVWRRWRRRGRNHSCRQWFCSRNCATAAAKLVAEITVAVSCLPVMQMVSMDR